MKTLIAALLLAAGFSLAVAASIQADAHRHKHLPLPLAIPALVCVIAAGVLVAQMIRADQRRWKALNASIRAATDVTLTRQQFVEPSPVSIETPRHVIDLIPIRVRELPR